MSKKPKNVIRSYKDTRGLPPGIDPRNFYVYASQQRHEQATGLEGLLRKYLPSTLFASVAFAIDPWRQFKVSLGKISPSTRNRSRKVTSILGKRSLVRRVDNYNTYKGIAGPHVPGEWIDSETPHNKSLTTYSLTSQEALEQVSSDTTSRLRVPGSSQGEFFSWKTATDSPSYMVYRRNVDKHWYDWTPSGYMYTVNANEWNSFVGPAAYIRNSDVATLRTSETALASTLMQKQGLSIFKGILPTHRTYTLFRNVVELRDLPRGVIQLRDSVKHFKELYGSIKVPDDVMKRIASLGTTLSDIPKEWLSYSFGWRQTYSDIVGLLAAPQKIGRKTDLLIKRNTKPTTYRSKRDYESDGVASAGFIYDSNWIETPIGSLEHRVHRKTQLRMVVNTTFEFPPIDIPRLRSNEFYRQLGVVPTFTDLYNLVPWTWLVDWFTGLGDYVEIIDNINSSPDLINWGLLTAEVQGELTTKRHTKFDNVSSWSTNSSPGVYSTNTVHTNHTSKMYFTLHSRKDISTLFNVDIATDPTTLTLYQQSILGALISTRTKYRR